MNEDQLRAELKEWFGKRFAAESFSMSWDEKTVVTGTMKVICSFLAQGVALLGCTDERYLDQIVELHPRLKLMCDKLAEQKSIDYHSCLIFGTILEYAAEAVVKVRRHE